MLGSSNPLGYNMKQYFLPLKELGCHGGKDFLGLFSLEQGDH